MPRFIDVSQELSSPGLLSRQRCVVCAAPVRLAVTSWTARCPLCGTWTSTLQPEIGRAAEFAIDDATRIAGLQEVRQQNFASVLDRINALVRLEGTKLLDVGCAYGWFLHAARQRGADAVGIEPDEKIAALARAQGENVVEGMFPEAADGLQPLDVIAYNDVLEHIPDARGALAASFEMLRPGGVLSVNIPTADGLGYRVATALARMGVRGPFRRFWQANLPSPHIYYFPRRALADLMTDVGFEVVEVTSLSAITRAGLWQRVHTIKNPSPASVINFLLLRSAVPILNRPGASDIVHVVARRPV